MPVDVSVIVPVFNTGDYIEPCIDSLLKQTLPRERYELIFVDDGSDDGVTPQRLDRLAAEEPNVTVFHEPNSGWPGRPRNVGIDHAVGDYVFFCDHDDSLGRQALERMVGYARQNDSDILIPKMVGRGRGVPIELFTESVPHATLDDHPLMSSMTPHKLFRRPFLNEHRIRFAEGRRRLEDHLFVTTAYFAATTISVLADYPYYIHIRRDDNANAAFVEFEPVGYYRDLRDTLDVIEGHTQPGDRRDGLLSRAFTQEMLSRFGTRGFHEASPEFREVMLREVRLLMVERFRADYATLLPSIVQLRAEAVRAGRADLVDELFTRSQALEASAVVDRMRWDANHWQLDMHVDLTIDGRPATLHQLDEDDWSIDPALVPDGMTAPVRPLERITPAPPKVYVEQNFSGNEWPVPGELDVVLHPMADDPQRRQVEVRGSIALDPARLAAGLPLSIGRWNIGLRCGFAGLRRQLAVKLAAGALDEVPPPAVVGPDAVAVIPIPTASGSLTLDVAERRQSLLEAWLARPVGAARRVDDGVVVPVGVDVATDAPPRPVPFSVLADGKRVATLDAQLRLEGGQSVLALDLRPATTAKKVPVYGDRLRRGAYSIAARPSPDQERVLVGSVVVNRQGLVVDADLDPSRRERPLPVPPPTPAQRVRHFLGRIRRRFS